MKITQYFIFNVLFAVTLYFGLAHHVEHARIAALIVTWIAIVSCVLVLISGKAKELYHKKSVPLLVDLIFDVSIGAFLLYEGMWITGALYLLSNVSLLSAMAEKDVSPENTLDKTTEDNQEINFFE